MSRNGENHTTEASVVTKLTWRLLPFLFLLYIVAYLDRINVGFAVLQMQTQLHFTDRVYGLGAGIFFMGYFFFQLPSNLALQHVGPRRWICLLMVLWGFVSCSMALVRSPHGFYALRFLLGAAEAGFFPGMMLYLKDCFPARARARAVAIFMTAGPLSGVVGGPISGTLLGLHNLSGLQGWQWLFLLEGLPAVFLGVIVLSSLPERSRKFSWLTAKEQSWLNSTLESEKALAIAAPAASPFFAFKSGRVWHFALVYFGLNTCSYGISLWLPSLIRSLSTATAFTVGVISTIPYLAAAVIMVLVGLHSDRTGERCWHVALSALAGAVGFGVAAYSHSLPVSIAAIGLAMTAVSSMVGPFWALPTSFLQGSVAVVGVALINSIGNLGGFFGPYIIGFARSETGTFRYAFLLVGGILAVSGFSVVTVRKVAPRATRG